MPGLKILHWTGRCKVAHRRASHFHACFCSSDMTILIWDTRTWHSLCRQKNIAPCLGRVDRPAHNIHVPLQSLRRYDWLVTLFHELQHLLSPNMSEDAVEIEAKRRANVYATTMRRATQ